MGIGKILGDLFGEDDFYKEQVIMSKANGELAVAIPLYRSYSMDECNYKIMLMVQELKVLAYVIDIGDAQHVMSAKFVEDNSIFLGDL